MSERRESVLDWALVRLIDQWKRRASARPPVQSPQPAGARAKGSFLRSVSRRIIDPTILPPPSYTRARADEVYGDAFRRCLEYVAAAQLPGDLLEFGSLLGYTGRWLAGLMRRHNLAASLSLFDSFEGLPEITSVIDAGSYEVQDLKVWYPGAMRVNETIDKRILASLKKILPNNEVHVVKGFFEDTLEANLPTRPAALIHLDCDFYSSARFVLDRLLIDGVQDGTLLVCDDYNSNRASPEMGERRAVRDAFAAQDRFSVSTWFSYGWHGQVLIIHDRRCEQRVNAAA